MKTAVIVDTAGYLSEQQLQHPDIYELPIELNFADGESFPDTAQIEKLRTFFDKVSQSDRLPSTSQPAIGKYLELLEELIDKGYEQIFSVHLSSGISGTYKTACKLLESVSEQVTTYCVDSKGASVEMALIVKQLVTDLEAGCSGAEAFERANWLADHSQIYLKVEDMNNLVKGGRLNAAVAKIGGVLRVRPVLHFDEAGEIVLYETMRSDRLVNKKWCQLAKQAFDAYDGQIQLAFAHADAESAVAATIEYFKEHLPEYQKDYEVAVLGAAVANYTAQGAVGFVISPLPQ